MKFHPLKVSFILFLSVPVVVGRSEAVGVVGGVPQESSSLVFFFGLRLETYQFRNPPVSVSTVLGLKGCTPFVCGFLFFLINPSEQVIMLAWQGLI